MNKLDIILKKEKAIPLDKFINIALYDKKHGYYMKKNPFGNKGDFITAPMVSNLFSEMIAVWCISYWHYLKKPKKIVIVELGPGNASLCLEIIKTFQKFPEFYKCLEIKLLEVSKKLKKIQKKKIKNNKVKWIDKIDEIKSGPALFLANEFFDALPIKQIYKKNNIYFERFITTSNKKKLRFTSKKASKIIIKKIKKLKLSNNKNIIEYPIDGIKYLIKIANIIKRYDGGLLAIDYGYNIRNGGDTLQSIKKHRYSKIFNNIGNSDITTHVNFKLMSNILNMNELKVNKIVTQSEFLQKLGIKERAIILANKKTFKEKAQVFYKLKKLLDYGEMGSLFKVLFAQKKNNKFNLGF